MHPVGPYLVPNLEHLKGVNIQRVMKGIKRLVVTRFTVFSWAHRYHSG
jgi:hypothetical protein